MNRKPGRKPLGERAKKERFTLRFSGAELKALRETAEQNGYGDVSKFVRRVLFSSPHVKQTMKELLH